MPAHEVEDLARGIEIRGWSSAAPHMAHRFGVAVDAVQRLDIVGPKLSQAQPIPRYVSAQLARATRSIAFASSARASRTVTGVTVG